MAMLKWSPGIFSKIFGLVACFDLNFLYMELTVDSMDGTETGSVTDLNIFYP